MLSLVIVIVCLLIVLAVAIPILPAYKEKNIWEELLALDSAISMEELSKRGYIDVSQVMETTNDEISTFLNNARNGRIDVLRIVDMVDGRLCAKILMYNNTENIIKMWTMYPNQQQAESPGKCFSTEVYEIEKDGFVIVFLENVPDESIPQSIAQELVDEKLYSYFDSGE